jgi:hypothetical protein
VLRVAHVVVTLRRQQQAAAPPTSTSSSSQGAATFSAGVGVVGHGGGGGSGSSAASTPSAPSVVIQGPLASRARGLVPLHAWVGPFVPFHLQTAVQQAAILGSQVIAIAAIAAVSMEAAGVNATVGDESPRALGFSPVSLTVVVALCAPLAAAIVVRTPLHLLLMWHRIRDRRRYYVKSFELGSERFAARVQTAARWAAMPVRKGERSAKAPMLSPSRDGSPSLSQWVDDGQQPSPPVCMKDHIPGGRPQSPDPACLSSDPDESAAMVTSPSEAACVDSSGHSGGDRNGRTSAADESSRADRRRGRWRGPTHATHVRVSAERSRAAAMAFAAAAAVLAFAGGVLATKKWCAEAQSRYNVALVAALGVDAFVVSPLWVAAVYLYRAVMAEPRVVGVAEPTAATAAPSTDLRGSTELSTPPTSPTPSGERSSNNRRSQERTVVTALVLHEPYPVHNAWRVASSL